MYKNDNEYFIIQTPVWHSLQNFRLIIIILTSKQQFGNIYKHFFEVGNILI